MKKKLVVGTLGVIGALLVGAGVCGVELVTNVDSAKEVVTEYKEIEEGVVTGYKNIENFFVEKYMNIEKSVVGEFQQISDKFVDAYLAEK